MHVVFLTPASLGGIPPNPPCFAPAGRVSHASRPSLPPAGRVSPASRPSLSRQPPESPPGRPSLSRRPPVSLLPAAGVSRVAWVISALHLCFSLVSSPCLQTPPRKAAVVVAS